MDTTIIKGTGLEGAMAAQKKFEFRIAAQGVAVIFKGAEDALAFINEELKFYQRVAPLLQEQFVWGNANYGNLQIGGNAEQNLSALKKSVTKNGLDALAEYMAQAEALDVLVGQGHIGRLIESLIQRGQKDEAKWLLAISSRKWAVRPELFAPLRAALFGNPLWQGAADLVSANAAAKKAEAAESKSAEAAMKLEEFIRLKSDLFDLLEDRYREKLVLEEPALFWANIAKSKSTAWRVWLIFFGLLVLAPLVVIVFYWAPLSAAVAQITTTSSGGISLAGLAAISIPAAFYAWLLKNVSRVFIQNLALADDAAHRRALSITYLGLAENPKLSISEPDRALILNALFRPIPPHSGDEGPPAGLIDLIRSK